MTTRKRSYIPLQERLAATLACLLPSWKRDIFRHGRLPAKDVISIFTFDHIHLHSLNGSDKWWNLDPRERGTELKKKDSLDTTIAAKTKRLAADHEDFRRRVLVVRKRKKRKQKQEKRKWVRKLR